VSGKGFAFFKNEPIEYVCAAKSKLNDAGARELSQIKSIRLLDVSETDNLSESAFIDLISALPNLEDLTFGSRRTTIKSFKALARPHLIALTVRCRRLPLPKGFGTELAKSKTLASLTLDDCAKLGEDELKEIVLVRTLEEFALKSHKVSIPMAKLMAKMSAERYSFDGCIVAPKTLTELTKKAVAKLSLSRTTEGDKVEIKILMDRGRLKRF
jgi:hypothetical protein